MDLFDFFFPEQAQATHLRAIAKRGSLAPNVRHHRRDDQTDEIKALKEDVNFLTLVLVALLRRFTETETASLADVQDLLEEIDGLDGVADGGLDPGVLRGLVLKQANAEEAIIRERRIQNCHNSPIPQTLMQHLFQPGIDGSNLEPSAKSMRRIAP